MHDPQRPAMVKGWKFDVYTERLGGGAFVKARYVVAISDRVRAAAKLTFKEGLLDERIEVVGEADQALLDQWDIKQGEVFCVVAWS
jgi:hypothetical protein